MTETLSYWYSSKSTKQELSNEYQHDRVWMFSNILALLCLGKSSLSTERVKANRNNQDCNDLLINDNKDAVFKMHILMWLSLLVQYILGYFSFLY